MAVIRCDWCDRLVDLDLDIDGHLWGIDGETPNGEDFICANCADDPGGLDEARADAQRENMRAVEAGVMRTVRMQR